MTDAEARERVNCAFEKLEMTRPHDGWSGVDALLPLLERMRAEGTVVLLKLDGERKHHPYTVVASGVRLGEDFFRTDSASLEEGLAQLVAWYGARFWGL